MSGSVIAGMSHFDNASTDQARRFPSNGCSWQNCLTSASADGPLLGLSKFPHSPLVFFQNHLNAPQKFTKFKRSI
jgi:hypothetical protein